MMNSIFCSCCSNRLFIDTNNMMNNNTIDLVTIKEGSNVETRISIAKKDLPQLIELLKNVE
jgi:hypothetical protein